MRVVPVMVLAAFVTAAGFAGDNPRDAIGRIANSERIMVVSWDGSTQRVDLERWGIRQNADVFLVVLTHGMDIPAERVDEEARIVAYRKRRNTFDLMREINARHAFLNLSFPEGIDWDLVLDRLAAKVSEYFPTRIIFAFPAGMPVNAEAIRDGLNEHPGLREHYELPLGMPRQERMSGKRPVWSLSLRYKEAQRNTVDAYVNYVGTVAGRLAGERTALQERIALAFNSVKWIENALQRDTSKVARALLMDRKWLFEELRSRWIGFDVECSMRDSSLTASQVTELRIGRFRNVSDSVYTIFPGYVDRWLIRGDLRASDYLKENSTIHVFSPEKPTYTVWGDEGYTSEHFRHPFEVIFVRFDDRPEYNCAIRKTFYFDMAPKITVSYSPSFLLAGTDQSVEFTMRNYSHDPLADSISVDDGVVRSDGEFFRFRKKYDESTVQVKLTWDPRMPDEPLAHPVLIGGIRVGLIPSEPLGIPAQSSGIVVHSKLAKSAVTEIFRRVNYEFRPYRSGMTMGAEDRIVVDRNSPLNEAERKTFLDAVRRGATAICLLEGNPWLADLARTAGPGFRLEEEFSYQIRPVADSTFLNGSADLFRNWLFHFAPHRVGLSAGIEVLVRDAENDNPLIFSIPTGKGRIIVVNLALSTQLVNTNTNGLRLLFALLGFRGTA